jgi:Flp pilus assembly protein TadD
MTKTGARNVALIGLGIGAVLVAWQLTRRQRKPAPIGAPAAITIDYPAEASIFPPEFPAPTWLWRDADPEAVSWDVAISFSDGTPEIQTESGGPPMRIGDSDPRAVSPTNAPPALTPMQVAAHTWTPDAATWSTIKQHSVNGPATIVFSGHRRGSPEVVSRGRASIQTSKDPVGAPIFYRDVPLMPSENEKGVIKPLAPQAIPLVAWRLRNVADPQSRLLMEGLHTCANCHSFSADGKTLGLDMDGPQNDKGLYALVDLRPETSIRHEDQIAWSTFRGKLGSKLRVGFMSQVSPSGRHVITTVNDPGVDQTDFQRRKDPVDLVRNYYVANFKDYRFLQVFYPTRGLLAWYSRESEHLKYLPGADDPRFVHANAVWSPDGKYLVFARAQARDAYPAGAPVAQYANDPNENPIQFDLYRIPFNDGKGGAPERIVGASQNGMSNSFPKVSPDGRWIVFVRSRNGLLMRPDGQLFIVPAAGGTARRMTCNTPLMNSWHSFSPNGRWLVFSSKSRSPYTQMFLTHINEAGNDSPAILIENATAANRAVNIPEFVNIPTDGLLKITAPAADFALHMDLAMEAMKARRYQDAVPEWKKAALLDPKDARVRNGLGVALMEIGSVDEAIANYREAFSLNPQYAEACNNLGEALTRKGELKDATAQFEKAVELDPGYVVAHGNLGMLLTQAGRTDKAILHLKKVVEVRPESAEAHRILGLAMADKGTLREARLQLEEAVKLSDGRDAIALHALGRVHADLGHHLEAIQTERRALVAATQQGDSRLAQAIDDYLNQLVHAQ